ncbi:surface-adhesin E family protein [Sphingomonas soli]|uniref:surface-adhesin E family protein n=1 Tax=Sphingomonas soli TaxID=266127 RepID=UPI0008362C18|nr:surface-adhesin E family protein [Sphingomonas soli]
MRFVYGAAAVMLAVLPAQAFAQDWYRAGGNANNMSYVDLASIQPAGGKILATTKSVYREQLSGDTGIYATQIRAEYDCAGNYFRTLEYTYFDASNKLMRTEKSLSIDEHKVPAKGSINEAMMNFICYRKGGTQVTDHFTDAKIQMSKM